MSRAFSQTFDGHKVKIGSLQMEANEKMVSKATGFPLTREKWFKGKTISYVDLNFFLLPEFRDPEWKDGVPYSTYNYNGRKFPK